MGHLAAIAMRLHLVMWHHSVLLEEALYNVMGCLKEALDFGCLLLQLHPSLTMVDHIGLGHDSLLMWQLHQYFGSLLLITADVRFKEACWQLSVELCIVSSLRQL